MVKLYCGCEVTEKGEFIVSERCRGCTECNLISRLHPFGGERLG